MRYYVYSQSSSGGYYIGPRLFVIQAESLNEANETALTVGVDPLAPYCECCGPRWSLLHSWASEGIDVADTLTELSEFHDLNEAQIIYARV